ncbi:uncharacterized protein LOC116027093 [Ipomoea triloba]|uniref:uncharacterized protein LOC116027093 n=1 Tax=Ipomoea triloba TaxID=35885 RepID=UPI00125E22DE|nr:uncharacterized protein LOC116027093 [Ipomoea triloba]
MTLITRTPPTWKVIYPPFSSDEWQAFNSHITKEEVRIAVSDMAPFKAPGPDGFHAAFYQQMWSVVGDSLFEMVRCAYETRQLPVGLNDTLIILIPKLVSAFQSSFVPGRYITDNVLIYQENGEQLRQFVPQRGIRQGDAMSPAIFVRYLEKLSKMISLQVSSGGWKGIRLDSDGLVLSHLCFADDMLLFSEASIDQVEVIQDSDIATRLSIEQTDNLGKYLGVPSIHGRVTCRTYYELLDRINSRLEGWRSKLLSMAGKVTLAKLVLNAIPLYTMQTTALLKGICQEIEKRTRRFIWGGNGHDTNKISLVNWETVTNPSLSGDLVYADSLI